MGGNEEFGTASAVCQSISIRTGRRRHAIAWSQYIATMQYIRARLIAQAKEVRDDDSIIDIVVWELVEPLLPCTHLYKYRLFFGRPGECFVRYDNERGKGDHRHVSEVEFDYEFISLDTLLADFERDVTNWRKR
jgi:hypothetical protein